VFNPNLSAHIHGVMAFTLWFGVFAFTLLYASLLDRRYRLMVLDEDREDREVAQAIRERVGAAAPVVTSATQAPSPSPVEVGVKP
jgi:hypothetical protein